MKAIGLDLGSRTLGVAVSDSLNILASPYETIRFKDDDYQYALKKTVEIIENLKVTVVVLGFPKHMNNDIGIRGKISIDFKENLTKLLPEIEVILEDERLSSTYVDRLMIQTGLRREERKAKKDACAAVAILQNYLDRKKGF